jgi:hypothetical protein
LRLLIDTLIAAMLVAILSGVVWQQRQQESHMAKVDAVQQAVRAIQSQAFYRGAVGDAPVTANGYAKRMDPAWFEGHTPRNLLVQGEYLPWIEIVQDKAADLFNPSYILGDGGHAEFWYNPKRGQVRARVPMQMTQEDTLDLYNLVNGTSLRTENVVWYDEQQAVRTAVAEAAKPVVKIDPVLRDFGGGSRRP